MEDFNARLMDGFAGQRMFVLAPEAYSPYMRHPLIGRMYLTDVGYFPHAARHFRERREGIGEYILLFCTEGSGYVTVGGRTVRLRRNEAFCVPRGMSHSYGADDADPWSILWVHFAGTDTELFPLREMRPISFESENAVERLGFLFSLLFRVLRANYTEGNFIYISEVLMLILAETFYREKKNSASEENRRVTEMIRYMQAHIDRPMTLEELCERFSLSRSYVHAAFRNQTGRSPMAFFTDQKMRLACQQLRATSLPVQRIAQGLGFQDPLYFSRAFRKAIGLSPSAYRAQQEVE